MPNTYWNGKGKYQERYTQLADELIPASGGCETLGGEVLRAATRIYWDAYNNGFCNNTSGARNFLEEHLPFDARQGTALDILSEVVNTGNYSDFDHTKEDDHITIALEEIVNAAVEFQDDQAANNRCPGGVEWDLFNLQDDDVYYHDEDEEYSW